MTAQSATAQAPPAWFADLLARYPRIAIAGGPKTGKTTLAGFVADRPAFSTDDLIPTTKWEDVPPRLIAKANEMGRSWVMEGVQVARALRKGMTADVVVYLSKQNGPVTATQVAMARAVGTVFEQWAARNSRVLIVRRP